MTTQETVELLKEMLSDAGVLIFHNSKINELTLFYKPKEVSKKDIDNLVDYLGL